MLFFAACASPTGPAVEALATSLEHEVESLVTASWTQLLAGEVHVVWTLEGEQHATPVRALEPGPQSQVLYGVPYDTEVEVAVLTALDDEEQTSDPVTATTGGLPEPLLQPSLLVADEASWEPTGNYLYTSLFWEASGLYGASWRLLVDRAGRVVWAWPASEGAQTFWAKVSRDGQHLLYDETFLFSPDSSHVAAMTLDGEVHATWPTPGIIHSYEALDDGSVVWGSYIYGWYEHLLRVDADGEQSDLWDCGVFEEAMGGTEDSCMSNSVWWDAASDTLVYSFFTSMTVVQLSREGETLESWGRLSDWRFDPPESQFDWQHGPTFTDEGTLLVSTHASTETDEGVVREYELDHDARALREVWSFGVGDGIPATEYGEAHRLPGGNTLHNTGSTPRVREATPEGEVVWDLAFDADDGTAQGAYIGRSVWLDDLYVFAP